jgi:hypothetical protein
MLKMYTHQEAVVHNLLLLKEITIPVHLPASIQLTSLLTLMEEKAYISTKTKIKQNLNIKGR